MFERMFADLATAFAEQFGAPFIDATAKWPGAPTYDSGGSITAPGAPVSKPCKVQFDSVTQAMRSAPDFLETDTRIIVLGASIDGRLDTAAKIVVAAGERAGSWSLLTCSCDPAGIGYECRGRRANG